MHEKIGGCLSLKYKTLISEACLIVNFLQILHWLVYSLGHVHVHVHIYREIFIIFVYENCIYSWLSKSCIGVRTGSISCEKMKTNDP